MMIDKKKLKDAVIAKEEDSILEVSKILRDTQRRHVVIVNEGLVPNGIISTVDINNRVIAEEKDPSMVLAKDVMVKDIKVIDILSNSFDEACKTMFNLGTFSMPVVENGKLIGMISLGGLL